eukprot:406543_1
MFNNTLRLNTVKASITEIFETLNLSLSSNHMNSNEHNRRRLTDDCPDKFFEITDKKRIPKHPLGIDDIINFFKKAIKDIREALKHAWQAVKETIELIIKAIDLLDDIIEGKTDEITYPDPDDDPPALSWHFNYDKSKKGTCDESLSLGKGIECMNCYFAGEVTYSFTLEVDGGKVTKYEAHIKADLNMQFKVYSKNDDKGYHEKNKKIYETWIEVFDVPVYIKISDVFGVGWDFNHEISFGFGLSGDIK